MEFSFFLLGKRAITTFQDGGDKPSGLMAK
jgi:hypothetical protein